MSRTCACTQTGRALPFLVSLYWPFIIIILAVLQFPRPAGEAGVGVRHDVAQFECTQVVTWSTRHVPAGPYAGVLPSR
jgi:hypothetical protein